MQIFVEPCLVQISKFRNSYELYNRATAETFSVTSRHVFLAMLLFTDSSTASGNEGQSRASISQSENSLPFDIWVFGVQSHHSSDITSVDISMRKFAIKRAPWDVKKSHLLLYTPSAMTKWYLSSHLCGNSENCQKQIYQTTLKL